MKKLFYLFLVFGILFSSCSSDDDTKDTTSAKDFIKKNKDEVKYTGNYNTSELPITIDLGDGVTIKIPANAITKDGTPITGDFQVEAYKMLTPSSIILSGTNTNLIDQNKYLETDGFYYINITQNGVPVDEKLAKNMIVSIPTQKEDGNFTQLWRGEGDEQFGWVNMAEDDLNFKDEWVNGQDFNFVVASNGAFKFSFGKLGWCNCDVLWGQSSTLTTVTVSLTGRVGTLASYMGYEGDTFVFFCGKGYPVVAQLYTKVDETTVKSYDNSMPVGAKGKMIAFSVKDGAFSYASQDVTITENMNLTLDLKEIGKDQLLTAIKALDSYK